MISRKTILNLHTKIRQQIDTDIAGKSLFPFRKQIQSILYLKEQNDTLAQAPVFSRQPQTGFHPESDSARSRYPHGQYFANARHKR